MKGLHRAGIVDYTHQKIIADSLRRLQSSARHELAEQLLSVAAEQSRRGSAVSTPSEPTTADVETTTAVAPVLVHSRTRRTPTLAMYSREQPPIACRPWLQPTEPNLSTPRQLTRTAVWMRCPTRPCTPGSKLSSRPVSSRGGRQTPRLHSHQLIATADTEGELPGVLLGHPALSLRQYKTHDGAEFTPSFSERWGLVAYSSAPPSSRQLRQEIPSLLEQTHEQGSPAPFEDSAATELDATVPKTGEDRRNSSVQ